MTTDTKVGLIVGLAFIVVFAIILSNRGQQSQLAPPLVNLADAESPLDPLVPNRPADNGRTNLFAHTSDPWPPSEPAGSAADRASRTAAEPPMTRPEPAPTVTSPAAPIQRGSRTPSPLPETTRTRDAATPPIDTPALPPARVEPPMPIAENANPRTPASGGRVREVKRGDLLAKIAKEAYGSDAPALVQALSEFNKLKSPNHIVIGQKLRIPPIEALAAGVGAPRPPAGAQPESAAPPIGKTYVVKAGDTLTSIAQSQLGQAARWREIVELNRITDPNRVVEGTTLKLPPASVAAATRSRNE
jgi:nucleoid-associated protein YgaU